jgi:hypothetical protein
VKTVSDLLANAQRSDNHHPRRHIWPERPPPPPAAMCHGDLERERAAAEGRVGYRRTVMDTGLPGNAPL